MMCDTRPSRNLASLFELAKAQAGMEDLKSLQSFLDENLVRATSLGAEDEDSVMGQFEPAPLARQVNER
jgi:hypothetical protein